MKKIYKYLKKHLTKERYLHTIGVAYTATSLAMKYNPDTTNSQFIKKAEIAGLLHDCAKCLSHEKRLSVCKKNHLDITEVEKENPVLHTIREEQ